MYVQIFTSILGLVLGEKEEIFAQWAGEFRHFLAAVMGSAGGITLPVLNTTVDLKTQDKYIYKSYILQIYRRHEKHVHTDCRNNEMFNVHLHQNVCEMFVSSMKAECCVKFLDKPRSSFGVPHGCCSWRRERWSNEGTLPPVSEQEPRIIQMR